MPNSPRRIYCWLPALLWMGLIFVASTELFSFEHTGHFLRPILRWLLPGASEATLDVLHGGIRKLAHMTEYAILATLIFTGFRRVAGFPAWSWHPRHAAATWFLSVGYAIVDEFHQTLVPSRTGNPVDVGWDALGAALLLLGLWWWRRRRPQRPAETDGLPETA